jgi:signal transduction histidine kinase
MKSFFQPAIAIMNRLRYPQKFLLVGALLLIPTMVLLTQYLNSVNYDIEFAENESIGTQYIAPLLKMLVTLQDHSHAWLRQIDGQVGNGTTILQTRAAFDDQVAAVDALQARYADVFSLEAQWEHVKARWAGIGNAIAGYREEDVISARIELTQDLMAVIAIVGNQSNLILDPDIDTYYLMDSVINHFPTISDLAGALGESISGDIDRRQVLVTGQLVNAIEQYERGIAFAYAYNPALQQSLAVDPLEDSLAALKDAALVLNELDESDLAVSFGDETLTAGVLMPRFQAHLAALDDLLQIRINGFEQARNTVILIAIAAVLASVYFFAGFYLAVRKTIDDLGHASDIMVSGSSSGGQTITLQNRDEMAEVVTSFNRVASEMVAARDQAVKASRLKDEFLATMSHELRTPLNSIIGYTGILTSGMRGQIDDTAKGVLIRVRESSQNLLNLINDILDIAKIEAGRMEVVDAPFELNHLVEQLQAQAEVLARQKQLNLEVLVDPELPKTLYGDIDKIGQVVRNLLSNAVKFTDEGVVRLRVFKKSETIIYEVTDTGVGIPPQAIDYIFDEFRQVDGTTRRVYGGTGLGLAIVRKLCLAMGGRVQVQSKIGVGSTFTVTLPLHAETTAASVLRSVSNE